MVKFWSFVETDFKFRTGTGSQGQGQAFKSLESSRQRIRDNHLYGSTGLAKDCEVSMIVKSRSYLICQGVHSHSNSLCVNLSL